MPLLTPGNKGSDAALEDRTLQQDTVLAFKALNPDVGAQPDYPPLITATGVFLLEAHHVTQLYFHYHGWLYADSRGYWVGRVDR